MKSPAHVKIPKGEDQPIGFDETPPWDIEPSTKNGETSSVVPYKKGWAMWNKYRDRLRYVWHPGKQLWLPPGETG